MLAGNHGHHGHPNELCLPPKMVSPHSLPFPSSGTDSRCITIQFLLLLFCCCFTDRTLKHTLSAWLLLCNILLRLIPVAVHVNNAVGLVIPAAALFCVAE